MSGTTRGQRYHLSSHLHWTLVRAVMRSCSASETEQYSALSKVKVESAVIGLWLGNDVGLMPIAIRETQTDPDGP